MCTHTNCFALQFGIAESGGLKRLWSGESFISAEGGEKVKTNLLVKKLVNCNTRIPAQVCQAANPWANYCKEHISITWFLWIPPFHHMLTQWGFLFSFSFGTSGHM